MDPPSLHYSSQPKAPIKVKQPKTELLEENLKSRVPYQFKVKTKRSYPPNTNRAMYRKIALICISERVESCDLVSKSLSYDICAKLVCSSLSGSMPATFHGLLYIALIIVLISFQFNIIHDSNDFRDSYDSAKLLKLNQLYLKIMN